MDLILSSGYLAFARHVGFLAAVEEAGLAVGGVCGTSSGALVGALWASGMRAPEIARLLGGRPPIAALRPSSTPWRGLLSLAPLRRELGAILPATFDRLPMAFGAGATAADGAHRLLVEGDLVESVLASCAVPYLFAAVVVAGQPLRDGGVVDRTALRPWRARRPAELAILHLIERSRGAVAAEDLGALPVVRSARSGASLWSLGDFEGQVEQTRRAATEVLARLAAPR
ncbi:MAG: patatin-like phospholipase family protein [Deltaproteobacteria bacterium]|nr:patatin-like phospholipase family protein [Deltaproteobacteria bacterium]